MHVPFRHDDEEPDGEGDQEDAGQHHRELDVHHPKRN
jgi:hypothetical protein